MVKIYPVLVPNATQNWYESMTRENTRVIFQDKIYLAFTIQILAPSYQNILYNIYCRDKLKFIIFGIWFDIYLSNSA